MFWTRIRNLITRASGKQGEKEMKTLKALAAVWLQKTGTSDVGFFIKSEKTKKVFQVVSKTPSGSKFVIVLSQDAKGTKVSGSDAMEYVVSGDESRYSMFSANGSRIAELESQISKLETQRDNLETEIEGLQDQLAELVDSEAG